jgi:hypothetical protein
MSGVIYGIIAHLSLIGELKKLGAEIHPFIYGQMFFIEFEYFKQQDCRSKKLDRLAVSSMVAFAGGPALAALLGIALR